jgi:3-oxoacyl-[acyl-carrier-protein] synthase-1
VTSSSDASGPYIIGCGLHSTLGRTLASNIAALREAIRPPGQAVFQFAGQEAIQPYHLLADEPLGEPEERFYRVVERVVADAVDEAQLTPSERRNLPLFLGSSSSDISMLEALYRRELERNREAKPMRTETSFGSLGVALASRLGLRGGDFTINTACTASANALLHAAALINRGEIEHALVIGVELCNAVTALGFSSLQLLSDTTMRPFDASQAGLILGEACAAVVLSKRRESAQLTVLGGANLCDTFSPSSANPDGTSIVQVIERALQSANLSASDIQALKVHGTANRANDEAESAGMRNVFGSLPPLCALKPRIGHTLGAGGLAELLLACGAAREGFLPAAPGIGADPAELGVTLLQQTQAFDGGPMMLNYFGFGGSNTSLIVSAGAS